MVVKRSRILVQQNEGRMIDAGNLILDLGQSALPPPPIAGDPATLPSSDQNSVTQPPPLDGERSQNM